MFLDTFKKIFMYVKNYIYYNLTLSFKNYLPTLGILKCVNMFLVHGIVL